MAPPALRAQYRTAGAAGASALRPLDAAPQSTRPDRPRGPLLPARPDSARRAHSLGRHLLVGAGFGAAVGLALGIISRNHSSDCDDCLPPTEAIPAIGAVVAAVAGTLVGALVDIGRSRAPQRRPLVSVAPAHALAA